MMKLKHVALLVIVALIWGANFTVIKFGLSNIPPLALSAMRFVFAAFPACLFFSPPSASVWRLIVIGMTLGTFMSAFQFAGMKLGLEASISSVVLQSQVFFSSILAMSFMGEGLTMKKLSSIGLGVSGLGLFVISYWENPVFLGFILVTIAAFWWALGNLFVKSTKNVNAISLMVWISFVPILPLTALSLIFEEHSYQTLQNIFSIQGILASAYLGLGVMIVGYGIWSKLLQIYEVNQVAPFSLLVPVFGIFFGMIFFDEKVSMLEILGILFIFISLIINILPDKKLKSFLK